MPFEIVPGISSAIAAPAYAGIPVTHRGDARSFAVLTGNTKEGNAHYQRLSGVDTLVLLMGVRNLAEIAAELIAAGRSIDTPAATIQWGTTPQQRVASGTLGTIAAEVERAGLEAPAVTVVGEVARLRDRLKWFESPAELGHPLLGKQVAVTRTRDGSSGLSDLLRARGANVLEVPLIRFEATGEPDALHARLRDLGGVDWLLLSSNQAVTALFAELDDPEAGRPGAGRRQAGGRRAEHRPQLAGARLAGRLRAAHARRAAPGQRTAGPAGRHRAAPDQSAGRSRAGRGAGSTRPDVPARRTLPHPARRAGRERTASASRPPTW